MNKNLQILQLDIMLKISHIKQLKLSDQLTNNLKQGLMSYSKKYKRIKSHSIYSNQFD